MKTMKKKIAVLCSGGVDSSVALHLLYQENKYDISVFYLKIWLEDELSYMSSCPWEEDLKFIKNLCKMLHLPLEIIPLQQEYWDLVVSQSIQMIKSGLTPNPDIFCNSMIKFGAFFDYIKKSDATYYIATGHYAKNKYIDNWNYIMHTNDHIKDQTYFLSYTPYEKLKSVIFPLGSFHNKMEVRKYAEKWGLPSAKRKDSQGICFLGKIPFDQFILHHCGQKKGLFLEFETKKIMGEHNGFWFFTIGQRQGIGLHTGPWYVIDKNIEQNIVYISKKTPRALNIYENTTITISNINFLVPFNKKMIQNKNYKIKIRHGQYFNEATILNYNDSKTVTIKVLFPDQGIAPGQILVFYDDEYICLGSGIISHS